MNIILFLPVKIAKAFFFPAAIAAVIAGLVSLSYAQETPPERYSKLFISDDTLVRGFIWGLPPEAILENEKGQLLEALENTLPLIETSSPLSSSLTAPPRSEEADSFIVFLDNIDMAPRDEVPLYIRSLIAYQFVEDSLQEVRITQEEDYFNPQDQIDDLLTIEASLVDKFGAPTHREFIWRDDREKNYPARWGWAVFRGNLDIQSVWETPHSLIILKLNGRNSYNPELALIFRKAEIFEGKETIAPQSVPNLIPQAAP